MVGNDIGGIFIEVRRVANVRRDFDRNRQMENCTPTNATLVALAIGKMVDRINRRYY